MPVQIKDIIQEIEDLAPKIYQESYDNSGIQVGNIQRECSGAIIALDATMAVVEECIRHKYNLIITHHPLLFKGLKSIQGNNEIEKIVIACIKHDICLYSCHTNLDNVLSGVNKKIADKLGLLDTSILAPTSDNLYKLMVYTPTDFIEPVREAAFAVGAGQIGHYDECSFKTIGEGTFRGDASSNPTIGNPLERTTLPEAKLEFLVNKHNKNIVLYKIIANHPYEEVAYEMIPLSNKNQDIGAGMIGYLPEHMSQESFLIHIKKCMDISVIKYTDIGQKMIQKVGICGGSGAFLIDAAKAMKCDAYITGDLKYHEYFQSEGDILLADIGHYESEQYTSEIFYDIIKNKFPNFAVQISGHNTNPIKYFY